MHPVRALIIVDLQNDFLPNGALAVVQGDQIIPIINALLNTQNLFDVIVASQDWHPKDHESFAANHPGKKPGDVVDLGALRQILWPVHCVQNSIGAELTTQLHTQNIDKIFHKGIDKTIDSYSTFFDNGHKKSTGLENYLREHGVTEVYIAGLATDYCVKYSVLDAIKLGFKTYVIVDGCRGVNLHPGDSEHALREMSAIGAKLITSQTINCER